MAASITVSLTQQGPSTSVASIREHTVLIDRPLDKDGADLGPMGGELLLAALGGCFMSNLLAAIRARKVDITSVQTTVTGTLGATPTRFTAISLDVTADCSDPVLLDKLVTIAERGCLVASTLRPAVELTFGARAEQA